jgi:hypothetical protein
VLPPLLVRMLDQQAATGLPPAYLPKDEEGETPDYCDAERPLEQAIKLLGKARLAA